MHKSLTLEEMEEFAFYESGLSSDGCLQNLDNFTKTAITKYGRHLLKMQKENLINGFQGCCYACEPVGLMNQNLSKALEMATQKLESINNDSVTAINKLNSCLL